MLSNARNSPSPALESAQSIDHDAMELSTEKKPHKLFRIVEAHRLHVTEMFLDHLKELFHSHYEPTRINELKQFVSLSDTNEIVFRAMETNEEVKRFPSSHAYSAKRIVVWENGPKGHIITLSSDSLRSRDYDNKIPRVFNGHKARLTTVLVSNDELYEDVRIVSGSANGSILIHSLKSAKILFSLDGHKASISGLCFTVGIGDKPLIATVDTKNTIILWENDSESANCLRILVS